MLTRLTVFFLCCLTPSQWSSRPACLFHISVHVIVILVSALCFNFATNPHCQAEGNQRVWKIYIKKCLTDDDGWLTCWTLKLFAVIEKLETFSSPPSPLKIQGHSSPPLSHMHVCLLHGLNKFLIKITDICQKSLTFVHMFFTRRVSERRWRWLGRSSWTGWTSTRPHGCRLVWWWRKLWSRGIRYNPVKSNVD